MGEWAGERLGGRCVIDQSLAFQRAESSQPPAAEDTLAFLDEVGALVVAEQRTNPDMCPDQQL